MCRRKSEQCFIFEVLNLIITEQYEIYLEMKYVFIGH